MISGPSCRDIDSADDFREEFSVKVGEKDSDGVGAAGDEASRAAVRDIAEASGDITDPASGFFADWTAAVEDAGYGSDRDVRFTRDVPDGDHGSCR